MTYVKYNPDNTIAASANWPAPGMVPAREEVVRTEEGQLVYKSELDEKHEEEIRLQRKQAEVRDTRNQYLLDTDKYVTIPDFPISESTKSQYIEYRQYLRDYPTTENWYESNPKTFDEYVGE